MEFKQPSINFTFFFFFFAVCSFKDFALQLSLAGQGGMHGDCRSGLLLTDIKISEIPHLLFLVSTEEKKSDDRSYFSPEERRSLSLHLP